MNSWQYHLGAIVQALNSFHLEAISHKIIIFSTVQKLYSEYIIGYNQYDTSLLNLALANDVLGFQQCSLKACHKLQNSI